MKNDLATVDSLYNDIFFLQDIKKALYSSSFIVGFVSCTYHCHAICWYFIMIGRTLNGFYCIAMLCCVMLCYNMLRPWPLYLNIVLNMLPPDFFMSCLDYLLGRAGASTRFTSTCTSTSTSTCNMCESESEYLIITWLRVRVRVLVDEYEYKCEYRSMINILYSMYRQQIFIVRSLTRESSDCYKPGTKLQLPIVRVNFLLSIYICLIILCNLIQWHFNLRFATYWLSWLTLTTCCQFKNRKQKLCNIMKCVENSVFILSLK